MELEQHKLLRQRSKRLSRSKSVVSSGSTNSAGVFELSRHGWKYVLLLQFQTEYKIIITVASFMAICCVVFDAAFAVGSDEKIIEEYTGTMMATIYMIDVLYFIDTIQMMVYKGISWSEVQVHHDKRHGVFVFLDVLSLVPTDYIFYFLGMVSITTMYVLRLRYVLRLNRIYMELVQVKKMVGNNRLMIAWLEMWCLLSTVVLTSICVFYLSYCSDNVCPFPNWKAMYPICYRAVSIATGRIMYFLLLKYNYFIISFYMMVRFICYLYLKGTAIGMFVSVIKQNLTPRQKFLDMKNTAFKRLFFLYEPDIMLVNWIKMFYDTYWSERRAIKTPRMAYLPEVLKTEIETDLSWYAYKHSNLFKNCDVPALMYLSTFVKHGFMVTDEVIFKKGKLKERMIYIVSGVVQILSEDNETPVMSLSGGTCLGEASLFLSCKSTCTVICQSYCEVVILERSDFINIIKRYPETYRNLRDQIFSRVKKAEEYMELSKYQLKKMNYKSDDYMTLKWIKMTMRRLLSDHATVDDYMKTLSVENRRLTNLLDGLVFCADYLDLLVPTDQIVLVTDKVFLKPTCPCILQPNSSVLPIWHTIIAVMLVLLLFIYPYFVWFQKNTNTTYLFFMYVITIFWIGDIYCQVSTAIKEGDKIYTQTIDIALKKVGDIDFVIDVLAAVPFEILMLAVGGRVSSNLYSLMQCNRLLKAFTFRKFFRYLEENAKYDMVRLRQLKYVFYYVILVYISAALMHNFIEGDPTFNKLLARKGVKTIFDKILFCTLISNYVVLGLPTQLSLLEHHVEFDIVVVLIQIFSVMLCVYFVSELSAVEVLKLNKQMKMREYVNSVRFIVKAHKMDDLEDQIMSYLDTQWRFQHGGAIEHDRTILKDTLPMDAFKIIMTDDLGNLFKKVPLFQELPESFIEQLSVKLKRMILPPAQVIAYAGKVSSGMYIIKAGFCVTISDANVSTILGPGQGFAFIETYMRVPIANSTITLTHCVIVYLPYEDFMEVVSKYPDICSEKKDMENWFFTKSRQKNFVVDETVENSFERDYTKKLHKKEKAFFHYGYKLKRDSKLGEDYFKVFEDLGYFQFVRYFFLPTSIICHGRFIMYWEIFRGVCAFISALLYPVPIIMDKKGWWFPLFFLDACAWLDIYLRHHVSYFNKLGVEVTHPLKTAIWYWEHSFFIDVLGAVPLYAFFETENRWLKIMLRTNHLIQVYRIVGFFSYHQRDMRSNMLLWQTLKFVTLGFVLIVYTGAFLVHRDCDFDENIPPVPLVFEKGVRCNLESWLWSLEVGPYSPGEVYLWYMYFVTSKITGKDPLGYAIPYIRHCFISLLISFVGFIIFEFVTAKIVAARLSSNKDLTLRQEQIKILLDYMSNASIDPKVPKEIVKHFEVKWKRKQSRGYRQIFECFSSALEEDAMFWIYGKVLRESIIFEGACTSFFRSLLVEMKHEIIITRGIISKVNDVDSKIYFIFKGTVDVLGPDYARLLLLPEGSVFGNLHEVSMSRRTLTMVAKGHVEVLVIEGPVFFKILSNYEGLYKKIRKMISFNTDYLIGGPSPETESEEVLQIKQNKKNKKTQKRHHFFNRVYTKTTKIVIWQLFYLIVVCYVGFSIEVYQTVVRDTGYVTLIFVYFFDFCCLVNMFIKSRLCYEDDYGNTVFNRKEIVANYVKYFYGFYFDLVSVLPFEIFGLAFINTKYFSKVFSWLRLNRVIRVFFVLQKLTEFNQRLDVNVYFIRLLSTVAYIFLFVQMATSSFITISCANTEINFKPPLRCCFEAMTSMERFSFYVKQMMMMMFLFTSTPIEVRYPDQYHTIILTFLLMFACSFAISFFTAQCCSIFEVIYSRRIRFENSILRMYSYLEMQHLTPALLDRVWNYVRLLYRRHSGVQMPFLLNELPYYLKEAVLNSLYEHHIREHHVLKYCHDDLVRQMASQFVSRVFFPGDYIAFIGQIDECMYFVHEGTVCALSVDTIKDQLVDHEITAGEMFGLRQGLLERKGHGFTYKAKVYTIVAVLERKKWIHLLNFFPASRAMIYEKISDESET